MGIKKLRPQPEPFNARKMDAQLPALKNEII